MPDRTVNELTDQAWGWNGIDDPTALQDTQALNDLQNMLSSWSVDGLVVPYYVQENFTLTIGQAIYTIGVTGDSPDLITSTGRPIKIIKAWIRQSNFDYPVYEMSVDQYARIAKKDTTQRPSHFYYDPQYPNGSIKFNYESDLAHDFHIISEKPLVEVTAKTDTFNIPLEMNETIASNLAIRLATRINNKLSDDIRRIAQRSFDVLEERNAKLKIQRPVRLDEGLLQGNYYR